MESGFAEVNGVSLSFIREGSGEPVVYVHGNTGSSAWFQLVMDLPGCSAVALDMPNFGLSSPLDGDISIQRYAAYVAGFMDLQGLKEAVVVGHSLGGCVVQVLALDRPDLVKAMVLVDSGAPDGLLTPRDRYPAIEFMRTSRTVLEQALKAVAPTLKDEALFGALVDDAQKMAVPAWIGNAEALSNFDVSARCAEYQGQVLVIRGTFDPIITDEMAQETARAYPHARLVTLEGVGHSVIVENPALFLQIFGNFLAEHGICKR